MPKYPKVKFLADVKHEIEMLKIHALPEEKEQLNFDSFDQDSRTSCIYGQMTGLCYSNRAKELMDLCCIRVLHLDPDNAVINNRGYSSPNFKVNGKYESQTWKRPRWTNGWERSYLHLSALEGYLFLKDAKNSNIISYIKGEIDILEL